ncbi:MAG: serine protein kinase RIO [Thermoplasmata archaeon]|nr:serine protein kinase RIO [Thermoplasmata archaeon]
MKGDRRGDDKWLERVERSLEAVLNKEGDSDQRKTFDEVFDHRALMTLSKMISNGVLDTVDFPVSTGKEGNVFKATSGDGEALALKIYRTSNANFKAITGYILGDPRFHGVSNNKRRLLTIWCLKEFKNLTRLHKVGVRVPEPLKAAGNMLLMQYIGDEKGPAPMLKQVNPISIPDPTGLYEDVMDNLSKAYQKARLVHADVSEYNILYWNEEPWIIDLAQGVLVDHPMAETWLERDVTNLCTYFNKLGVDANVEETLAHIRGGEKKE